MEGRIKIFKWHCWTIELANSKAACSWTLMQDNTLPYFKVSWVRIFCYCSWNHTSWLKWDLDNGIDSVGVDGKETDESNGRNGDFHCCHRYWTQRYWSLLKLLRALLEIKNRHSERLKGYSTKTTPGQGYLGCIYMEPVTLPWIYWSIWIIWDFRLLLLSIKVVVTVLFHSLHLILLSWWPPFFTS